MEFTEKVLFDLIQGSTFQNECMPWFLFALKWGSSYACLFLHNIFLVLE